MAFAVSTARPVALLVLAVLALTAVGAASPQPEATCGSCGMVFERVAEDRGLDVNVTRSEATIRVHENESATWTVTNTLAANGSRPTETELTATARATVTDGWGVPHSRDGTVTVTDVRVDNRTVVLRFRDADGAQRRAGLLVVDYFQTAHRGGWRMTADTIRVVGPAGTTAVNDPDTPSGTGVSLETGRALTLGGDADHPGWFSDDLYVVFGDDPAQWRVGAAVALATAPIWVDNVTSYVLPGLVGYALLLVVVTTLTRSLGTTDRSPDRLALGVGLLGWIGTASSLLSPGPRWYLSFAVVFAIVGSVAAVRPSAFRSQGRAVGLGVVTALVAAAASLSSGIGTNWATVAATLPVALGPAYGLAVARASTTDRGLAIPFTGMLVTAGVTGSVLVPPSSRPSAFFLGFVVFAAIWVTLCTLPLAAVGFRAYAQLRGDTGQST